MFDLGIRHAVASNVVLAVPGSSKSPCHTWRDKFREGNRFLEARGTRSKSKG
jgi:hypothetical protein